MTRDTVLAYIRAIEAMDLAAVERLLHPDAENLEHPNKLNPKGVHYTAVDMCDAAERGKAIMASQRYEIRGLIVEGDSAAVQIAWTGVLKTGAVMHAQICSIIQLRDGKIWRQEQYDCF